MSIGQGGCTNCMHASSTTRWHLLHVCLVPQMFAPQQAHRTAVNPKVDKLGAGAAAMRCERAGEATTRDDGSSNVKA